MMCRRGGRDAMSAQASVAEIDVCGCVALLFSKRSALLRQRSAHFPPAPDYARGRAETHGAQGAQKQARGRPHEPCR